MSAFLLSKYDHDLEFHVQEDSGATRTGFPDVTDIIDIAGALTAYVRYGRPL